MWCLMWMGRPSTSALTTLFKTSLTSQLLIVKAKCHRENLVALFAFFKSHHLVAFLADIIGTDDPMLLTSRTLCSISLGKIAV
jgi:hypothetical protein